MTAAVAANRVGRRFHRRWALRDCTFALPEHRVVGLVGPNGAGKTTLLHLATGLLAPTEGELLVLGHRPAETSEQLADVGFVAQQNPLYDAFTVAEQLELGRRLNPRWDAALARRRIEELQLDPRQRTGKLSGGQHAQLALTLAVAKRPRLLLLDEPVASLDPLARHEFLQYLMAIVADDAITVVLSSHLVADLERVCDHLLVLTQSQVRLAGDVDVLLEEHRRISGPRRDPDRLPSDQTVIEQSHAERQSTFLIQTTAPVLDPAWTVTPVGLEELVLAYLKRDSGAAPVTPTALEALR